MVKDIILYNHILLQELMKNLKPALKKSFEATKKPDGIEKFMNRDLQIEYTEMEQYHRSVFGCCMNIQNTIERINAISVYVSDFPTPKKYSKKGINKKDWITYHYANFGMAKVSLYDLVLLLVNEIFALGLRPQNCNKETVRENKWIKNSKDIADSIDTLEKVIANSRYPRNLFLHRGILPYLDNVDILNIFDSASAYSDFEISIPEIEKLYKMVFQEISEEIKEDLDKLETIIIRLFDAILLEYNKRIKSS